MLVLHDEATCLHRTLEGLGAKIIPALECPERIEKILEALRDDTSHEIQVLDTTALIPTVELDDLSTSEARTPSELEAVVTTSHNTNYLNHLRTCHSTWVAAGAIQEDECVLPECFPHPGLLRFKRTQETREPVDMFARAGAFSFDLSTGISKHTWASALASANLALEGARIIANSSQKQDVLALCRPPGHHCTTEIAGGYCYLNNAVVAVESLRRFGPGDIKVAIVDIDFHHGNGTQGYFYRDPSVLYVSIHGENEYPYYTGFENEEGEASGKGYNINLPLPSRSSAEEYFIKVETAVRRVRDFKPTFLVVSLGFDTFHLDPLGSFNLRTENYEEIAFRLTKLDGVAELPSLLLLEGGYVLDHLGANMLSFLKGWKRGQ